MLPDIRLSIFLPLYLFYNVSINYFVLIQLLLGFDTAAMLLSLQTAIALAAGTQPMAGLDGYIILLLLDRQS